MINIIKCSKIIVKNSAWVVTRWRLDANRNDMYTTNKDTLLGQQTTIDLKALGIQQGIQFAVKANIVAYLGNDALSDVILEYSEESNVTITLKLTGTTFEIWFKKV